MRIQTKPRRTARPPKEGPRPRAAMAPPSAEERAPTPTGGGATFRDLPLLPSRSEGQRAPSALGQRFQERGDSVGNTRLHTGAASARAADALDARAFTVGRDVHFGRNEYQPASPAGQKLIAHELAHSAMQTSGRAPVGIARKPKKGGAGAAKKKPAGGTKTPQAPKAPKPKPIVFELIGTKFNATVDTAGKVTVTPVKAAMGWVFTQAGPNVVTAERSPDNFLYAHAGGKMEALKQRTTVRFTATGATVDPIRVELGSPATLTLPLDSAGRHAGSTKAVKVFDATVTQIDPAALTLTFSPVEGDTIHLGAGHSGSSYTFTQLKPGAAGAPKPPAAISGFFDVGFRTSYFDNPTQKRIYGISSHPVADATKKAVFDDLAKASTPAKSRITAEEAAIYSSTSLIEDDLAGVQTYDSGVLSLGVAQWTVHSDLPKMLAKVDAVAWEKYLGRYGLSVGAPNRAGDAFVKKFIANPKRRTPLAVRNPSERALFLNGKDVVSAGMLSAAEGEAKSLATLKAELTAAKAKLPPTGTKTPSKDQLAAIEKVKAISAKLKGLPGMKTDKNPATQADLALKAADDAETAAKDLVASSVSEEVLRSEVWALRFEMLGESPEGRDAQVAQMRETRAKVLAMTVEGVSLATLLPGERGRAIVVSSYFNLPGSPTNGMKRAVAAFKAKKKAEAKAGAEAAAKAGKPTPTVTEADWNAFPWKTSDPRWGTLFTSKVADELENLALQEVPKGNTDPDRRRKIIKANIP